MESVKLSVYLPQETAIKHNAYEYGPVSWPISKEIYGLLTEDERDWLATSIDETGCVDGHSLKLEDLPNENTVVAAIRKLREKALARAAKKAAEEEEEKRKKEEKLIKAVSLGDKEFLEWYNSLWHYEWGYRRDPRVVARWDACAAYRKQLEEEQEARVEEAKKKACEMNQEHEKEEATKKAEIIDAQKEFEDFALNSNNEVLVRTARDGYSVVMGVLNYVLRQFIRDDTRIRVIEEGTDEDMETIFVEHDSPSGDDFTAYDRVKALLDGIEKPASLSVELLNIKKITVWEGHGEHIRKKYIANVVAISSPITATRWAIFPYDVA